MLCACYEYWISVYTWELSWQTQRALCTRCTHLLPLWHSYLESDFSEVQICLETAFWWCASTFYREAQCLNTANIGLLTPGDLHRPTTLQPHNPNSTLYPQPNIICFRSWDILTASNSGSCTSPPLSLLRKKSISQDQLTHSAHKHTLPSFSQPLCFLGKQNGNS